MATYWIRLGRKSNLLFELSLLGQLIEANPEPANYVNIKKAKLHLSQLLSKRKVLIVLDDVWRTGDVDAFKFSNNPNTRLLITTRLPKLAAQVGAQSYLLDVLSEEEGLHLIEKWVDLPHHELKPYRDTYRAIVNVLDGHTLALTLAAAKLKAARSHSNYPTELLERLQERLALAVDPFRELDIPDSEKDYSVGLSLGLSYDELPEDQQRYFRLLGVFTVNSTFDEHAAAAVWGSLTSEGVEELALNETRYVLEALHDKALLERVDHSRLAEEIPQDSPPRYRMHGLLRAYAWSLAKLAREDLDTQERHLAYYHTLLSGDQYQEDYANPHIMLDLSNIISAIDFGYSTDSVAQKIRACDVATILQSHLKQEYNSGKLPDTQESRDQSAKDYNQWVNKLYYNNYSNITNLSTNKFEPILEFSNSRITLAFNLAWELANRTLSVCKQIDYVPREADTHQIIGDLYQQRFQLDEAQKSYKTACEMYHLLQNQVREANTLHMMGHVSRLQTKYEEAQKHFFNALKLFRNTRNELGEANTLFSLGDLALRRAEYRESRRYLIKAQTKYRRIEHNLGLANTARSLSLIEIRSDKLESAREYISQAQGLYKLLGDKHGDTWSLKIEGDLDLATGDFDSAQTKLEFALKKFQETMERNMISSTLRSLGELLYFRGRYQDAFINFDQSVKSSVDIHTTLLTQASMAATLAQLGKDRDAVHLILTSLYYFEKNKVFDTMKVVEGRLHNLRYEVMGEERFLKALRDMGISDPRLNN